MRQDEKVDSVGVFLQDTIALSDSTRLSLGVRHDTIEFKLTDRFLDNGNASGSRRLSNTSPVIGLTWERDAHFSAYLNRATSFESPTTTELSLASGGFNNDLEPQLATSYEAGIRGNVMANGIPTRYSAAVYTLSLEDELIPIEQADGNDVFFNAGETSRRGIELDASSQLSEAFSLNLAYTWSDFEFDAFTDSNGNDFAGLRTPGTPEHAATLSLDYRNNSGGFASVDVEHVGDIVLNNANTEKSAAHTLVSLRAGFTRDWGPWKLSPFIGVQNIGNTGYFSNTRTNAFGGRYFEPGPGRNVYGGISVRYQPD